MIRFRYFVGFVLLTTVGAAALRLPNLSRRPMHLDEAIHTVKFNELWQEGRYIYDVEDYHGPTLYYFSLPAVWLSGARNLGETSEATFRIVPVVFGLGLILLLLLIGDGLGRAAAACAGALAAVSPALVFYSRYYIQETLLVFFTFLAIAAGWRYVRSRRIAWAILAGLAFGLMHATKETCIIAFGCLAAALMLNTLWHWRARGVPVVIRGYLRPKPMIVGAVLAIVVSVAFYSALFTHAAGPLDSVRTFWGYFDRAGGHGRHDHAWWYYLKMLAWHHETGVRPGPVWSEGLILGLALIGGVASLRGRGVGDGYVPLLRFLTIYTLLLTLVYSAIRYKTPWCMASFLHGMTLLAGVGAMVLVRMVRKLPVRVVIAGVLAALTVQLAGQAARATSMRWEADNRNPYAYAHTTRGAIELGNWIERVSRVHPDGYRMRIHVIASAFDYWPLPWQLRRFDPARIGYWETPADVTGPVDAPVIVTTQEHWEELKPRLSRTYKDDCYYGIRADVTLMACVDLALYEAWAETQRSSPPTTGGGESP